MPDGARGFDEPGPEVSTPHSGVSKAPTGLIGLTIDQRYRVEALLGEGGMGLVYRVTHTRLNKALAIKVLRRENTGDPEAVARFRREAESASAIGNQHIVDISDFGTLVDGSTYFVMECLEGVDLIDAIDVAQRMPEDRAIHIALQLCRALGAAHDAGIIHRDLKPENVFLIHRNDTEDFVKVLDFGIAKVANGPKRLTRAGEVLGTPHYMSPEQCEGDNVDHRTDIYALGVLLYEMVTGHVPHDADTMMGILTKHMYEDPIPPKLRVPQVSAELEQVIMRCLEKKPEQRYQTMTEIEDDLRRVHVGQQPVGPDTVTLTPTRPPPRERSRVSPIYLAGLGIAVLALVGTLAMNAYTHRRVQPERAQAPQAPVAPEASAQATADAPPTDDQVLESNEDQAIETASKEPTIDAKAARPKPVRRKSRQRSKPSPQRDQAILDPWK
jgi:serine/threonine protein kinase